MDRPKRKQKAVLFLIAFIVVFGLWNAFRWSPKSLIPIRDIPIRSKMIIAAWLSFLFLITLYLGNRLLGDARRIYRPSNQRLKIPSIHWIRFFNPIGPFYNLYLLRSILFQFIRRDIEGRYKGSFLGLIWAFINPLLMLMIYSFIFSVVFRVRWQPQGEINLGEFALTLFSGLIAFNVFSETINRAPGVIVSNPNYVKKVIFPLEILPVSALGASVFQSLISIAVLITGKLLIMGSLSPMVLLLPLVFVPLLCLTLGLTWILSSLGVFIRDTTYAVTIITQILFFMSPIFYPIEAIPEKFRFIIQINPLSGILENFRSVLIWDRLPDFGSLLIQTSISFTIFILGYMWFMKTKPGFADVL